MGLTQYWGFWRLFCLGKHVTIPVVSIQASIVCPFRFAKVLWLEQARGLVPGQLTASSGPQDSEGAEAHALVVKEQR